MVRSVLVTGAADGIGRGIATCFAEYGDRVALLDYDVDKLERTAAELRAGGRQVLALQADVRDAVAIDAAVARTVEAHDGLDVAVNNAAVYPNTPVVDMDEDEWDRVMDTNLKGAFLFVRAAARQMLRQGRGGQVCLIGCSSARKLKGERLLGVRDRALTRVAVLEVPARAEHGVYDAPVSGALSVQA